MDTGDDTTLWRRQERDRLIAARMAIGPELHRRWSDEIARRLMALLQHVPGRVVGLYWPHKAEFDPRPLAAGLIEQGRDVALPAIVDRRSPLEYRAWHEGAEMETGSFGIPAPKLRQVVRPDILIVPLVGFDEGNYRLGYGGGYFDRTLAALDPRPVTIGAGFELSHLATIFPQPHDIALDYIVTETRLWPKASGD